MQILHQTVDTAILLEQAINILEVANDVRETDPSTAILSYKEARKYFKRLKKLEPESAEYAVKISICCERIGDLYNDTREKREWYLKCLEADIEQFEKHCNTSTSIQMISILVEKICNTAFERHYVPNIDFKICGYGKRQTIRSELPYFEKILELVEKTSEIYSLNFEQTSSILELRKLIQTSSPSCADLKDDYEKTIESLCSKEN